MAVAPQTDEQIERRLVTQRSFAIFSFAMLVLMTVILLSFGLSSDTWAERILKMSGVLGWFYGAFVGPILAYYGKEVAASFKAGK